jgi:chromosome segregation ATPase
MTPRTLVIINTIGCLLLTALVVVQWRGERKLGDTVATLRTQIAAAANQAAEDAKHRAALERDIAVLKETIEATQKAAESSTRALAEKEAIAERLQTELTAATEQVAAWETALKARDARIVSLAAEIDATRKRLDEAIAKLKEAGAR